MSLWNIAILSLLFCGETFASVSFIEILPNTTDDTNLEYIDIVNTGCDPVALSGYILEDASGRQHFIADETLAPHERRHFPRSETHLQLNNTDETLTLADAGGNIVDTISWEESEK